MKMSQKPSIFIENQWISLIFIEIPMNFRVFFELGAAWLVWVGSHCSGMLSHAFVEHLAATPEFHGHISLHFHVFFVSEIDYPRRKASLLTLSLVVTQIGGLSLPDGRF